MFHEPCLLMAFFYSLKAGGAAPRTVGRLVVKGAPAVLNTVAADPAQWVADVTAGHAVLADADERFIP
jgi:hypothetical protein